MRSPSRRRGSFVLAIILVACTTRSVVAGPPPGGVEGIHGAIPGFPVNSCYVCHDIVPGATGRDSVKLPNETCFGCHTDGPTYGEGDPFIEDRPHAPLPGRDRLTGQALSRRHSGRGCEEPSRCFHGTPSTTRSFSR